MTTTTPDALARHAGGIVLTVRVTIPATPGSVWFTQEDLDNLSDAEVLDVLAEDVDAALEGATWMIERLPAAQGGSNG